MGFLRGVGIFVVVLVFVFGFMFFVDKKFVGNVIWEPGVVGDCVDSEILALWDEVFVEGVGDVVILKDFVSPEGDCGEYIAYKNDSGGFWVLYGDFYDSSWDSSVALYSSGKKVLDSVRLYVFYGNVSSGFLDSFVGLGDVSLMIGMILGIDDGDVGDWSVLSEDDVRSKFDELFGFVNISGISFDSGVSAFSFSESEDFNWNSLFVSILSRKNKALFSVEYWDDEYDPGFFVEFLGEIGDFVFFVNSSWNFAFDLGDYFNVSENVSVEFDYVGENNSGGEWVNYSFNGSDVLFMPAVGFEGWREFRIIAESPTGDVISNNFSVNITIYNAPPVLTWAVPDLYVVAGGSESVDLSYYFEDEDSLSYGVVGAKGIVVSFSGSVMKVSVDSNFSDYSRFRVYAYDGTIKTYSDYVYVVLKGDVVDLVVDVDEMNISVSNSSVSGSVGGESSDVGIDMGDNGWIYWGMLGLGVFVLVGDLMFFLYFFVLRGKRGIVSGAVKSVGSPVEDYVNKLGIEGGS